MSFVANQQKIKKEARRINGSLDLLNSIPEDGLKEAADAPKPIEKDEKDDIMETQTDSSERDHMERARPHVEQLKKDYPHIWESLEKAETMPTTFGIESLQSSRNITSTYIYYLEITP